MSFDSLLIHTGTLLRQSLTYDGGTPVAGPWSAVAAPFPCRLAPLSQSELRSARSDQRGYDERANLFLRSDLEIKRTDRIVVDQFPATWEVTGISDRWDSTSSHHLEVSLGRITGE